MSYRSHPALSVLNAICAYFILTLVTVAQSRADAISEFSEPFETLNAWEHVALPGVPAQARFELKPNSAGEGSPPNALRFDSASSASILIFSKSLMITEQSVLRWSWQILNSSSRGDPSEKSGDDYSVRIYLVASSKNSALTLMDRMRINLASAFGGSKPGPTLGYVWTSSPLPRRCFPSPYTKLVKLIGIPRELGKWSTEEVNPGRDFQECFGAPLSDEVRLGIMTDSDNTRSTTVGLISDLKLEVGQR